MNIKDLMAMPLHTQKTIDKVGSFVVRVPGGWVYKLSGGINTASVFVPEPPDAFSVFGSREHADMVQPGRGCPV